MAGSNCAADWGIKLSLFKGVSPGEFEPWLFEELYQDDMFKRGIMILLEPLSEKYKILPGTKEYFKVRVARIKQNTITLFRASVVISNKRIIIRLFQQGFDSLEKMNFSFIFLKIILLKRFITYTYQKMTDFWENLVKIW